MPEDPACLGQKHALRLLSLEQRYDALTLFSVVDAPCETVNGYCPHDAGMEAGWRESGHGVLGMLSTRVFNGLRWYCGLWRSRGFV
jgi:hypothetical protein